MRFTLSRVIFFLSLLNYCFFSVKAENYTYSRKFFVFYFTMNKKKTNINRRLRKSVNQFILTRNEMKKLLAYNFYILWSEVKTKSKLRLTEPALHCLRQAVPPRSWALRMVMNPWFDRITMIVILINCVTLGMYRPCEDNDNCTTYRCYVLSTIDHIIFAYFALEMVCLISFTCSFLNIYK